MGVMIFILLILEVLEDRDLALDLIDESELAHDGVFVAASTTAAVSAPFLLFVVVICNERAFCLRADDTIRESCKVVCRIWILNL